MHEMCVFVVSGPCMLQRQAAVFGTASAEDLRGPCQMQQPEERGGVGPTQPHAGDGQMDPRGSVEPQIPASYCLKNMMNSVTLAILWLTIVFN